MPSANCNLLVGKVKYHGTFPVQLVTAIIKGTNAAREAGGLPPKRAD